MQDFRFKRLEQFRTGGTRDQMEIAFPLPKSPEGRIQRYCPNVDCAPRRFQLGDPTPPHELPREADAHLMRRAPGTAGATCPYCGTDGDDKAFIAPEDLIAAKEYMTWAVHQDASDHMDQIARDFNRKVGKNNFLNISMSVKRNALPKPNPWREDLLRGLTCSCCGRAYGVYAIALFCPDCGARNVHVHFSREMEIVRKQIALSEEAAARGDAELAFRLLGNAHEDVLTALETYLKTIFLFLVKHRQTGEMLEKSTKEAMRGNPFQNIERTTLLYASINIDPFKLLDATDRAMLEQHIEKRHVIGHNLGLIDQRYLQRSSIANEGESVRLHGIDIARFAEVAERIVIGGIEQSATEFIPQRGTSA